MRCVDVNETHAFVATDVVSVYTRGTGQCVFRLISAPGPAVSSCLTKPTAIDKDEENQPFIRLALHSSSSRNWQGDFDNSIYGATTYSYLTAVQVSPDGRSFVATGYNGYLFHVSGFDTETHSENKAGDIEPAQARTSFTRLSCFDMSQLAYDGKRIVASGVR